MGRSNTDTQNAGATPRGTRAGTADKEEGHSKAGEATRTAGTGNQNGGDGGACAWEVATIKGMAWPASPVATGCQGQPLLNRHQVGGVSRSPDGLFAQQEREPIRGRPAVRGKSTYGGRPGQRVEEQGTWASQKHSKAGYGRPVDRGVWTAKTVKRPRQQPAHPQYANYWAPLTPKRHTKPHSAQPHHTNYWAPRTRKRHQQEHRPQRLTDSSDPMQHAKGRTGDRPGPRKGATTRRNVTQGVVHRPTANIVLRSHHAGPIHTRLKTQYRNTSTPPHEAPTSAANACQSQPSSPEAVYKWSTIWRPFRLPRSAAGLMAELRSCNSSAAMHAHHYARCLVTVPAGAHPPLRSLRPSPCSCSRVSFGWAVPRPSCHQSTAS